MLFRITASVVLVALGIASPWLVHDWVEWQEHRRALARMDGRPEAPEHSFIRRSREGIEIPEASPENPAPPPAAETNGEVAVVEPLSATRSFPVASQTVQILEGLVSRPFAGGPDFSLFSRQGLPGTERSEKAVQAQVSRLEKEMTKLGLRLGDPIFLRIFKESGELEVWASAEGGTDFTLFRIYRLAESGAPGPKRHARDGRMPEGFYYVPASRLRPGHAGGLAIDIGFPNAHDAYRDAEKAGVLIAGGYGPDGSFLLPAGKMQELYTLAHAALGRGQRFFRVHVFPFRMTDARMDAEWEAQPEWIDFWANLKEGYDFFENAHFPPDVSLRDGDYSFAIR